LRCPKPTLLNSARTPHPNRKVPSHLARRAKLTAILRHIR
jgi:hypothetical protein